VRRLLKPLTVLTALSILTLPVYAELGSDVPNDLQLLTERAQEGGPTGSGIFDIAVPPSETVLRPVTRVPRESFGVVGPFPLQLQDLRALVFPDTTLDERKQVLEGLTFFTTPHTAIEGLGPMNNQAFCLGCHLNTAEAVSSPGAVESKILHSRIYVRVQCRAGRTLNANEFPVYLARSGHRRRSPSR